MTPTGTNKETTVGHVTIRQALRTRHGVKGGMINDHGRIGTGKIVVMKVTSQNIIGSFGDCGSPARCAFRVEVRPWQLQGPIRMCTYECFLSFGLFASAFLG